MEQKIENIGSHIREMVRKRKINIVDFAKQICCCRENVYNIFKRNRIDIELLARISNVLGHNFFADIAENMDLAIPTPTDKEEEERRKAIYQFLEVVPKILNKHKINGNIVLGVREEDEVDLPLPDYMITPYMFTLTVGETIEERLNGQLNGLMTFQKISDDRGNWVLFSNSSFTQTQYIDIKLDYKTKEEWESVILLAMKVADEYYNDKTKSEIGWDLQMMKLYD